MRHATSHEHKQSIRRHRRPRSDRSIIIVAPPEVSYRIEKSVGDLDVIAFRTLDELDLWRTGKSVRPDTIIADFFAALSEIGIEYEMISPKLRQMLETFAHHTTVPSASDLVGCWPSRRSFYRVWSEEIAEPPSSFLRRVRTLHAARLMDLGASPKEAAHLAGFGSTDRLRRLLAERRKKY